MSRTTALPPAPQARAPRPARIAGRTRRSAAPPRARSSCRATARRDTSRPRAPPPPSGSAACQSPAPAPPPGDPETTASRAPPRAAAAPPGAPRAPGTPPRAASPARRSPPAAAPRWAAPPPSPRPRLAILNRQLHVHHHALLPLRRAHLEPLEHHHAPLRPLVDRLPLQRLDRPHIRRLRDADLAVVDPHPQLRHQRGLDVAHHA